MQNKTFVASAIISELQSSDIYLTVKARLFDLQANLNGVRVTAAFMDEIVMNEDKYNCIFLYADVNGLIQNRAIGHMYNPRTRQFGTTPIGSFHKFYKEQTTDNTYLVAEIRIMKRNKAVCRAISQLFAQNALKFSFQINCGQSTTDQDGVTVIDADPTNYFQGAAVVSFPACEDAVALQLVAECMKGDENMQDEIKNESAIQSEQIAETIENAESNSQTVNETETASAETPTQAVADTSVETAAQMPDDNKKKQDENKEDPQKPEDKETPQKTKDEQETAACSKDKEQKAAIDPEDNEQDDDEQDASCKKKAESDNIAELTAQIAELTKIVAELKTKIESQSVPALQIAEAQNDIVAETAEQNIIDAPKVDATSGVIEINPFMAEMSISKKYSLLERQKKTNKYSLLDRY